MSGALLESFSVDNLSGVNRSLTGKLVIEATESLGTARICASTRLDDPVPEVCDLRGEGVADFSKDRVWMADRVVTARISRKARENTVWLGRPVLALIHRLAERLFLGQRKVVYDGGALREHRVSEWKDSVGAMTQPKFPRHPLCAFGPLERAELLSPMGEMEFVRDVKTEKFSVALGRDTFDAAVWAEIQGDGSLDHEVSPVAAILWIDGRQHLRRVAFEGSRSYEGKLWCITEFWDFGVKVSGQRCQEM